MTNQNKEQRTTSNHKKQSKAKQKAEPRAAIYYQSLSPSY
jgi:hypothetical protein